MLKIFKCSEKAIVPSYATSSAACFDIHACLENGKEVKSFTVTNTHEVAFIHNDSVVVEGGERMLIPTRLKFDIPEGYSIRLHPRSGLALKNGIMLSNCEGIVDEDYVNEVFVILHNTSNVPFVVNHGDRIAQAELVRDERVSIAETDIQPETKTNRTGGFGSTGV